MTLEPFAVAIDGPVAAGKTTLGKLIADRLGALFFDTGVLYRAVAYDVVRLGIDPEDHRSVAAIAREIDVDLRYPSLVEGRSVDVLVNGRDVTDELRSPRIDRALPGVSANPKVREYLLDQQRLIAAGKRIIVVGRDIGTVVLPNARYKYFVEASPDVRAERRYQEMLAGGADVSFADVKRDLDARDRRDIERADAPLRKASDAILIDATELSASEISDRIVEQIQRTQGCRRVD